MAEKVKEESTETLETRNIYKELFDDRFFIDANLEEKGFLTFLNSNKEIISQYKEKLGLFYICANIYESFLSGSINEEQMVSLFDEEYKNIDTLKKSVNAFVKDKNGKEGDKDAK